MTVEVWSWRQAIQRAQLQSTSKLVLFNLSVYMNECGESCYPTTRQQASDTGLSERAICTHLEHAVKAGFLEKAAHGFGGQGWARNEYMARMPAGFVFKKGAEPRSARSPGKALNHVPEGTERSDGKALNHVQCNSPSNSPVNSPRGSFQKNGKEKGPIFTIDHLLSDDARARARAAAPGWDLQRLMVVFDTSVRLGHLAPPECPDAAFVGWCKKYTKGKRP